MRPGTWYAAMRPAYACEMDDSEHRRMAEVLHSVKGMVMLCGYDCELYSALFGDWERIDRDALADGARPRTESLWLNPAAFGARKQQELPMGA